MQAIHHPASDMPQPPGQLVSLHCRAHRTRDDQSHLWRLGRRRVPWPRVDNQVWLHGASSMLHRGSEIGRPRHTVPRGQHRRHTGVRIKQSASDGPCGAGLTRSPALPGCACAAGSREHGLAAGCSAGMSACPLPRLSPRYIWHRVLTRRLHRWNTATLTNPRQALCLAVNRRGPHAHCADRSRIADFRATRRGY